MPAIVPAPLSAQPAGGAMGRIRASGRVRIGVWLGSAPYGQRGPDGQPVGLEVEVARDIAASLSVTAELVPLSWEDRLAAVVIGHVDLACALIILTPERLRRVAFAHPHGQIRPMLMASGQRPIANLSELAGQRVAGRSMAMLSTLPPLPHDVSQVLVKDYDQALAGLLAGEFAAVVIPEPAFRRLALGHPEALLYPVLQLRTSNYAVALRMGEPDLLHFLNTWVFLREEDGTLAALHETFVGGPPPILPR